MFKCTKASAVIIHLIASRPFDVLILGFGRSGFSPTIAAGQSYEGVIELGYQLQLNPGGAGNTAGIFATTLQITLNL